MKLKKTDILKALEKISAPGEGQNLVESGSVTNVQVFGDEVEVDVTIKNPSLQAKKKTEVEILKIIHSDVYEKAKIKVNLKVDAPAKQKVNQIKGNPIPGIQNIIAVASENYGVKLLSIGFFTQPNQAVIWRGPMAAKALNQMIFDAHWGELDFLLLDLPPGTGDIHLSIMQSLPVTGAVVVSTPQEIALADARKGVAMFQQEAINVPVLGIVENMAYFTPAELPDNKYHIFGENGAKNLSEDLEVPFLGEIPLVQSIREAGDVGRPAALQTATPTEEAFEELTKNVVQELVRRNTDLPPTEAIKITTMAGCSAVKKK